MQITCYSRILLVREFSKNHAALKANTAERMFKFRVLTNFRTPSIVIIFLFIVLSMALNYILLLRPLIDKVSLLTQDLSALSKSATLVHSRVGSLRSASSATMDNYDTTVSYVTTPNEEVARELSKKLVENRLAACVNIVKGVESVYEWRDKVENDSESLMIIKSHSSKIKDLTEFVEKNHPYDCPEVVTLKVDSGSKPYLDWVRETINKKPIVSSPAK